MLFYEPLFLTLFPCLFAAYFALRSPGGKKFLLLLASAAFYAWGEPLFVPVLLVSTYADYLLSKGLQASSAARVRKALLVLGVAGNLAILVFYKYADFLLQNVNGLLARADAPALPLLHIALPIGVSFVVFEKITYLVDTYRGISRPAVRFSDYALFVLFFPKLLAGPILKYHEMDRQIENPAPFASHDAWHGFQRFARGVFKKLLLADPVGAMADQIFAADPWAVGAGYAWLGVACFALQIFFDFSGYSDMAIGLARMLGFRLRENFNHPYVARSLTDFWQRWHISLTTWIRDYLYIPLGGNRVSRFRIYVNLWICFLLSGLWHGASWNFVIWGAYNGLVLTLDRIFLEQALRRAGVIVSIAVTLVIVLVGWAIFRSPSLDHLGGYLASMAGAVPRAEHFDVSGEVVASMAIGILVALLPAIPVYASLPATAMRQPWVRTVASMSILTLFAVALARAVASPFQPFIYFRF